ncbi:very short patch repair endonuclease [Granulicella mallensis]|uniref:DNA mismatch endonuclease Vsr n=2 Tax=Granulicella mallensis TaxID=940614 RepID=G8P0D1_GRAMM|nr:DNA mismatch endonuclease Vsr [Granulicella mallensis MP5ACTX8]MBB5062075.1 DNA mismatch endonuclease (patch repair protein) [Granulicella mallensis]
MQEEMAQSLPGPVSASQVLSESWATSPAVRRVMQGNKSRDTKPEIAVRSAVHALGMRYRVSARPLPDLRRTADLVFRNARVAVFVDGCFWHGCPVHHAPPKTNAGYWATKVQGNRRRDRDTTRRLRKENWTVLRFWAHEAPLSVATQIATVVRKKASADKSVARGTKPCQ